MSIRANKKLKNEVSINEPIGVDKEGNEITFLDIIKDDGNSVIDQVDLKLKLKKLYEKMESTLKGRELLIIKLRYGMLDGRAWTQMEIANHLNISRSYVSRIEKKALNKLNAEMKHELD